MTPPPPDTVPLPPITAATVRSAVVLLRERFWLRIALVVVALSVLFALLGRWQLHRHEAKVARNDLVNANYDGTPVPVQAVLATPGSPLPAGRQWTRVRLDGVYDAGRTVLIRNRPLDGDYGFEVVVPLRLPSGDTFLVDRGWIPAGERFVTPDVVPAPPAGRVDVVVHVRPGEPPLDRTPPPGQELRIDLGRLAAAAGGTVYRGAYGVLAQESPRPATAPALLPRPDQDLGPHLAYAVQWWLGAAAGYVLLGFYGLKEVRLRQVAAGAAGSAGSAGEPKAGEPTTHEPTTHEPTTHEPTADEPTDEPTTDEPTTDGPVPAGIVLRGRFRRGRRREPTDEEWEDAATQ